MIVSEQVVPAVINVSSVVLNDNATPVVGAANLELRSMEAKRIDWETGAFRTSNQALYQVLAECLAYSGELPIKMAKHRNDALAAFYKERGYRYKEDAPLVTRVCIVILPCRGFSPVFFINIRPIHYRIHCCLAFPASTPL